MVFFVLGTTNRRGDEGERGKEDARKLQLRGAEPYAAVESQMRQAEGRLKPEVQLEDG